MEMFPKVDWSNQKIYQAEEGWGVLKDKASESGDFFWHLLFSRHNAIVIIIQTLNGC